MQLITTPAAASASNATVAARYGSTDWSLTRIHTSVGTACDHCGRKLKNLYDVRNGITGETMTIGRGCCKKVTGWTLSAAEAARLLRQAEKAAREDAAWSAFADAHPRCAATVLSDREAEIRYFRAAHPTLPPFGIVGEFRHQIRTGTIPASRWGAAADRYLASLRRMAKR